MGRLWKMDVFLWENDGKLPFLNGKMMENGCIFLWENDGKLLFLMGK